MIKRVAFTDITWSDEEINNLDKIKLIKLTKEIIRNEPRTESVPYLVKVGDFYKIKANMEIAFVYHTLGHKLITAIVEE